MLRRTPLKPKREKPRRVAGRIPHKRTKPKAGAGPDARQQEYHAWLRDTVLLCECGCGRLAECTHHILARLPGKKRRDHWYVVRLSHECHNLRSDSVHGLGSEAKFYQAHGADLVAASIGRRRKWMENIGG